jgi:hypothetical protein
MNLYLLAHQTLGAQLQIFYGPNGVICQQKDHSLVGGRF